MKLMRRVVFDTSTLVGAALKPDSVPHRALSQALARADVCASVQTWLELERVLQHKRFDSWLDRPTRVEFAAMLRASMRFFAVTPSDEAALHPPCRDPSDNKFLALAKVCQADVLVSSDDDLLVLHPWQQMPVLRAREFLLQLGQPLP